MNREPGTANGGGRRERGEPVRGPEPQSPPAEPETKEQYNFTAPESRIMKAAVERTGQHRTVGDLLAQPAPEDTPPGLSGVDAMRHRLRTASGHAAYKKRKETVEPVFGIVKAAMGFRRFIIRQSAVIVFDLDAFALVIRRLDSNGAIAVFFISWPEIRMP